MIILLITINKIIIPYIVRKIYTFIHLIIIINIENISTKNRMMIIIVITATVTILFVY